MFAFRNAVLLLAFVSYNATAGWITTDLGSLGGKAISITGINSSGRVIGNATVLGTNYTHAFISGGGALIDLGTLGGNESYASGVNSSGQVVGWARTTLGFEHAFVSTGSDMVDLGTLGGVRSYARSINDLGMVVGSAGTGDNEGHAFIATSAGIRDLGTLGGPNSAAVAINAAGQVAGYSSTGPDEVAGSRILPFLFSAGNMIGLESVTPGQASRATAINAGGQVTGWSFTGEGERAFLYSNGVISELGTLGGKNSYAIAMNDAGLVVGGSTIDNRTGSPTHAFITSDDGLVDLGALGGLQDGSFATGINSTGQVVGFGRFGTNESATPFFYDKGVMYDVSALASEFSNLDSNIYLNNNGQLAGTGIINGQRHAYLMTQVPDSTQVPEPNTFLLFGVAVFSMFACPRISRR